MISKTDIRKLIDDVETDFRACWSVLADIKEGPYLESNVYRMMDFQPQLAKALFRLSETYNLIATEKKAVIQKKHRLSPKWFRDRMRSLAEYQGAIKSLIPIGKALGDSFAWIFYQRERQLLSQHLEHERIDHSPTGIGGRGELEFIKNVRHVNGLLVLYHGITTFLRHGDISLIDLKRLRVTAIGDLKTTKTDENRETGEKELTISFSGISTKPLRRSKSRGAKQSTRKPLLTPEMRQRLKRQLDRIQKSLVQRKPDVDMRSRADFHYAELKKLAGSLSKAPVIYQRVGMGLLLVGIKTHRRGRLASKVLGKATFDFDKHLKDLAKQAVLLMDIERARSADNDNAIIIGNLRLETLRGTIPIFWWPIPIDLLERMFFLEAIVVSVYNPTHLLKKLRAIGFEVEVQRSKQSDIPNYVITKTVGNSSIELGINYFLSTIQGTLISEDAIVETIAQTLRQLKSEVMPKNVKIELNIQHFFQGDPGLTKWKPNLATRAERSI